MCLNQCNYDPRFSRLSSIVVLSTIAKQMVQKQPGRGTPPPSPPAPRSAASGPARACAWARGTWGYWFRAFPTRGECEGSARGHEIFQATNSFLLCLFVFLFLSKRACPTDLITFVVWIEPGKWMKTEDNVEQWRSFEIQIFIQVSYDCITKIIRRICDCFWRNLHIRLPIIE